MVMPSNQTAIRVADYQSNSVKKIRKFVNCFRDCSGKAIIAIAEKDSICYQLLNLFGIEIQASLQ